MENHLKATGEGVISTMISRNSSRRNRNGNNQNHSSTSRSSSSCLNRKQQQKPNVTKASLRVHLPSHCSHLTPSLPDLASASASSSSVVDLGLHQTKQSAYGRMEVEGQALESQTSSDKWAEPSEFSQLALSLHWCRTWVRGVGLWVARLFFFFFYFVRLDFFHFLASAC